MPDSFETRNMAPSARMKRAAQVVTRSTFRSFRALHALRQRRHDSAPRSSSPNGRFRRLRPQPMHSPVSASRRQTLTQGVSKEVPADYSADYVGIGATGSQKLDIRGRLQGVSAYLKSRHAARTSTAHSRQTKESGYRGSTE